MIISSTLPAKVTRSGQTVNAFLRKLLVFLSMLPIAAEYAAAEDVGALGYIAPEQGIINIPAGDTATIDEVFVKQNQVVKAGDPLASLSTAASLQGDLVQAEMLLDNHLKVTEEAIKLQQYTINWEKQQELQAVQLLNSYQQLPSSSKSISELQLRQNTVTDAKARVRIANATLSKIKIEAEAETRLHKLKIKTAKALLDSAIVKAPSDGTILSIMKHAGESSAGTILTMADLDNMIVKSEVFANDLFKISNGMSATIESDAIPEKLYGTVYFISNEVDSKSKVSHVYIRLKQANLANRMIGMEVDVTIHADR